MSIPVSRARSAGWSCRSPFAVNRATSWRAMRSRSSSAMMPAIRARRSRLTCRHHAGGKGSPGPMAARMFHVATRMVGALPITRGLLDRTREESLDEEPLQGEEHEERDDHQQERAGGEQMPFRAVLREQVLDRPGHRELRRVLDED